MNRLSRLRANVERTHKCSDPGAYCICMDVEWLIERLEEAQIMIRSDAMDKNPLVDLWLKAVNE